MQLLSDNPIEEEDKDKYKFDTFVKILGPAINETTSLPFSVGIYGDWGTGKTSLMHLLEIFFEGKGCKTVWFNPWKYDKKEEIWTELIQAILLEIHKDSDGKLKKNTSNFIKKLAWFTVKRGVPAVTRGMVSSDTLEEIKNKVAERFREENEFFNTFENTFSEIVKEYVQDKKLIVFIDDLDRCTPDNAITILESLKLYLNNSKCIFIIGMDRTIVEIGINQRYGENEKFSGHQYLDKIIQLPFFLPPVPFEILKKSLISQNICSEYSKNIWSLLELGLGGNPRKAKRFVNSFFISQEALKELEIEEVSGYPDKPSKSTTIKVDLDDNQLFYLAKILVIQMSFTEFYEYLLENSSGWELYETILHTDKDKFTEATPENPVQFPLRKAMLNENPELEKYWNNRDLQLFMERTSGPDFPDPPSSSILDRILRYTSIVKRMVIEAAEVKDVEPQPGRTSASIDNFPEISSTKNK